MAIHVDYEAVRNAANRLSTGQGELETQLTQLKSLIDGLITSGFVTDQASSKFGTSYQQWDTGVRNAISGLSGMSGFLNSVVSQHEQLDTTLGQATGGA